MPNPISSSDVNQSLVPDPVEDDPQVCSNARAASEQAAAAATTATTAASPRVEVSVEPPDSNSAPGTKQLVERFSKSASSSVPAEQSLYHTVERSADGEFKSGSMGVYQLQNADGSGATVLGASLKKGVDKDLQLTAVRSNFSIEQAGYGFSLSGDAGAFRANSGVHNDDGSVGKNVGLIAEAAGLEATLASPLGSITLGAGVSIGVAGSSGVRDADHDGKPEYCAKLSIPALTLGYCLEQFW